jgi:hypothetical protein
MPAIQASEKSDIRKMIIDVAAGARISFVVAVAKTPAQATINVMRLSDHSGVQSWQISNRDFMNADGRVTREMTLRAADRFQIDFIWYATGPEAEVMFKVTDDTGKDRYRRYRVNDGDALFDPWGAVAVVTS